MTDTPGTLEERMKSRIADWHDEEAYEDWLSYQREYAEAADEIASLRARVEALRKADWLNMMPREIVARCALAEGCREETAEAIRSGLHVDVKIRAEVAVKLIGMLQQECFAALSPVE